MVLTYGYYGKLVTNEETAKKPMSLNRIQKNEQKIAKSTG